MAKLERATVTPIAGSLKDQAIEVLFNPTEYSLDRSNAYKSTAVPGFGSPLIQFVNGEADILSMELFLDDYTDPPERQTGKARKSVRERVDEFASLLQIDGKLHAPPPVRFAWGRLEFTGIIEKLGSKVSLFHPDGTPARVRLTLTLREYRTIAEQLIEPRLESADKSKRRVMTGGDSLWALAAREYADPAAWRRIAEANDIDDPRSVAPGDWLVLPPVEAR